MFLTFLIMCKFLKFSTDEVEANLKDLNLKIIDDQCVVSFWSFQNYLKVFHNGWVKVVKWGNKHSSRLPRTGYCKRESFEDGRWKYLNPSEVKILASTACTKGVWYQVREAIKGVILLDDDGQEFCYLMTEPATHYFKTMTGAERMPVLINQIL